LPSVTTPLRAESAWTAACIVDVDVHTEDRRVTAAAVGDRVSLSRARFAELLVALARRGYRLLGPVVRDGAIVYDEIAGIDELPAGWTAEQAPGRYRLARRDDGALFGYAVGPQSWKRTFFVPTLTLWRARRKDGSFQILESGRPSSRVALIGARGCDLAAIAVQDRTFVDGAFADPDYAARRREVFVLAVHCGQSGGTCFCVSMGTGPRARAGFDLAATELAAPGAHRFVVDVGSEAGAALVDEVGAEPASDEDRREADARVDEAARTQGRSMEQTGIKELLYRNQEHPRWDDVAARCLGCANCTNVCPTCFCSTVEDSTDLAGETAERVRHWDSCFTLGHSHVHGGSVRTSLRARYRQWLTHKVAYWIDQFGVSGCVGCGRCITWCPVGIDITEEVAAIRADDRGAGGAEET
jgi:ferredoxin